MYEFPIRQRHFVEMIGDIAQSVKILFEKVSKEKFSLPNKDWHQPGRQRILNDINSYALITDNDLMYTEGQEDQFLGRIQKKTGKTKEELKEWIDNI